MVVKEQLHGLYAGSYDSFPSPDPIIFTDVVSPQVRKWIEKAIRS